MNKGVAGFRIDAIPHLFEVDKAAFGGRFPDEPRTGYLNLGPDDYDYLDHIYTKDQDETYDMVYQWREIFDEFEQKDGVPRVIMTEAYTSIQNTIRYYGEGSRDGAHMPFNFALISDVNGRSSASEIKYAIDKFLTFKPIDKLSNWVVSFYLEEFVSY